MLQTIIIIIIGWLAGCLVNYLADVLPIRRKLTSPFCLSCEATQSYRNYLIWPRRCETCGKRRPIRTWIVEVIYIFIALWLWNFPPDHLGFGVGFTLLIYFGLVVVIDLEYRLILHPVSLIGGILGLIIGIWLHGITNTLIGGIAGFGIMFALYFLGAMLAKVIAKAKNQTIDEDALGFGDVMLGSVLGLLLGWPGIVLGLILAVLIGGLVSMFYVVWLLVKGEYKSFIAIPYGPFLIAGCVSLLYFRDLIVANLGN